MLRLSRYSRPLPGHPAVQLPPQTREPWCLGCNDVIGSCAWVAAVNLDHAQTVRAGAEDALPEWIAPTLYSAVSGYNPADGTTDVGESEPRVLSWWRSRGLGARRIAAYAQIDGEPDYADHIRLAVAHLGGVVIGLDLPEAVAAADGHWDVGGEGAAWTPGSWGGHAVACIGYDGAGVDLVTWGRTWRASWAFIDRYHVEVYAVVPESMSLGGLDTAAMMADVRALHATGPFEG